MINRRLLRIKAVKSLYALHHISQANYELSQKGIAEIMEENIYLEEEPDHKKNAELILSTQSYFRESVAAGGKLHAEDLPINAKKIAIEAYKNYLSAEDRDRALCRENMLKDCDSILPRYVSLLHLLLKMSDMVEHEYRDRMNKPVQKNPIPKNHLKLSWNKALAVLREDQEFRKLTNENPVHWEPTEIWPWYKALKEDEEYKAYMDLPESDFETDKNMCEHIMKNVLLKNEAVSDFFEETDLNWEENRSVLRSLLTKTIKSINEDGSVEMKEISKNWDSDREYFKQLFDYTISDARRIEPQISEKLKNWDMERVALMDRIILKTALCEMIHFQSIPVKVTINEFVELAKNYSTPRSGEFINGILDPLSIELVEKGVIRKSGRGLIDNA